MPDRDSVGRTRDTGVPAAIFFSGRDLARQRCRHSPHAGPGGTSLRGDERARRTTKLCVRDSGRVAALDYLPSRIMPFVTRRRAKRPSHFLQRQKLWIGVSEPALHFGHVLIRKPQKPVHSSQLRLYPINTPTLRMPSRCCARAASGHAAAAPPSSVMNSRRVFIRSPRRLGRAAWPAHRCRAISPSAG